MLAVIDGQGQLATGFAPFAVTPDEFGSAWLDGVLERSAHWAGVTHAAL